MAKKVSLVRFLFLLFYSAVVFVMCLYIKKNAYYNFDLLMYSACAMEEQGDTPTDLHRKAYALYQDDLGKVMFERLTDSTNYYRNAVYKSVDNFEDQLPFFRIKALYVSILKIAYKLGYSPLFFSTWLNLFCYPLIAFILLIYLVRHLGFVKGYFTSFCCVMMPTVLDTAKTNTPDLLTALFLLCGFLCLLSENRIVQPLSVLFFCLQIFTRPESILFVLAFCGIFFFLRYRTIGRPLIFLLAGSAIVSYLILSLTNTSYPWTILYKHSFHGFIPDIRNTDPSLSIGQYLWGFKMLSYTAFHSEFFLILLFLVLPLFFAKEKSHILTGFIYVSLSSIVLRLLLFPDLSARFYVGMYLIAFLIFVRLYFLERPMPEKIAE